MIGVGAVGTVVLRKLLSYFTHSTCRSFLISFFVEGSGVLIVDAVTGAAAAIIWASDGTAVDAWKIGAYQVQPHVYAAMLETAMVLFTLSALGGGVVVAFWRQLLGGTTVSCWLFSPLCVCADLVIRLAKSTSCTSRRFFYRLFGVCVGSDLIALR
jgi:hypothetical protein